MPGLRWAPDSAPHGAFFVGVAVWAVYAKPNGFWSLRQVQTALFFTESKLFVAKNEMNDNSDYIQQSDKCFVESVPFLFPKYFSVREIKM